MHGRYEDIADVRAGDKNLDFLDGTWLLHIWDAGIGGHTLPSKRSTRARNGVGGKPLLDRPA